MSGRKRRLITIAYLLLILTATAASKTQGADKQEADAQAIDPELRPLIQLIRQGKTAEAVQLARDLDEDVDASAQLIMPMAKLREPWNVTASLSRPPSSISEQSTHPTGPPSPNYRQKRWYSCDWRLDPCWRS